VRQNACAGKPGWRRANMRNPHHSPTTACLVFHFYCHVPALSLPFPAVLRLQPGESRNPAHLGEYRCETVLLVPATRAFIPLRWRWISCAVVLSDEAFLSRLVVLVFFWFEIRTGALPLNGLVPFVVDRLPSLSNRIQE